MRRSKLPGQVVVMACALVLSMGVLVAGQAPAYSHDHRPPDTVLKKGDLRLQKGRLGTYCWTTPPASDGTFGVECIDVNEILYPRTDFVEAGSRLHIRGWKSQRPQEFSIRTYRKVNGLGYSVGETQRLEVSLRRVVRDDATVAWDAFFRVSEPDRHYYLSIFGIWEDEIISGLNQDASYYFHVKTRPE